MDDTNVLVMMESVDKVYTKPNKWESENKQLLIKSKTNCVIFSNIGDVLPVR